MPSQPNKLATLNEHFSEYHTNVGQILKKIIAEEFQKASFDKGLKLKSMEVYRQLELIRHKSDIDQNDIHYIVREVIPKEPDASYIDQHKTLYAVIRAYRFTRDALDKLEAV